MLFGLHVKNFAIIDEVEIEFGDGLNILTGETGAGKSILIGSISAALGGRTSKDIIGRNGEYALVELTFEAPQKEVEDAIEEMGFSPEDGVFIISRKITESGRSIFRINSETATASQIKEVAMLLMSVHGQSEYMNLLSAAKQLELVDDFDAEHILPVREAVKVSYQEYRAVKSELDGAMSDSGAKDRQMDYLKFAINEIEAAALKPGEDEELMSEYKLLSNAQLIAQTLSETESLIGEEGCADLVGKAVRKIQALSGIDGEIDSIIDSLSDVESLLSDANRDISDYFDHIEDNSERLSEVSDRIDLIDRLKSKYGRTIEDIAAQAHAYRDELAKYEDFDAYLEGLKQKEEKALIRLKDDTAKLSKLREESAKKLSALIRDAMKDLCFNRSELEITLEKLGDYTALGKESAQILVSLNVGEPMLPLSKVASGGELSRIMLAIKSVFAGVRDTHTLIFDEIDAGISGRAAQSVAEKLVAISGSHQVIAITHLPQIAAMADTHFLIEKSSDDASTKTSIVKIERDDQVLELARLTGGSALTESVMKSAGEMKELADEKKRELRK